MRVLCIDGVKLGQLSYYGIPADLSAIIYEGEVYTVAEERIISGIKAYRLQEKGINNYRASRFILCSDQNNLVLEDVLLEVNTNK